MTHYCNLIGWHYLPGKPTYQNPRCRTATRFNAPRVRDGVSDVLGTHQTNYPLLPVEPDELVFVYVVIFGTCAGAKVAGVVPPPNEQAFVQCSCLKTSDSTLQPSQCSCGDIDTSGSIGPGSYVFCDGFAHAAKRDQLNMNPGREDEAGVPGG